MRTKLFKMGELFFDIGDVLLEGWLLEGLGFLVGVNLIRGNKFIERFAGVFGEDSVGFSCGILACKKSASAGRTIG